MSWIFSRALVEKCVNYTSSPELVEASLPANCSDIDASAQSNASHTPRPSLWHDKTTEPCDLSRFGMTCVPLTVTLGEDSSMWLLEGFRATTSARLEPALGSMEKTAASGRKWLGSFARFSPSELKWKTAQCSLLGDSDEFSETWPRWGSMRNGECFLRRIPGLPICESASGFWQTPVADDAIERKAGKWNSRGEPKLSAQVKLAPTPTASDTGFRKGKYAQGGTALSTFVGGHLNPDWEEWLMGWPIGWTALEPLEWGKYREWQLQHSPYFQKTEEAA